MGANTHLSPDQAKSLLEVNIFILFLSFVFAVVFVLHAHKSISIFFRRRALALHM
jgi:hypothetical protein